jgi:NAD(P)-dependent dehydrogenase (short-subunit alcohol dehydrogenase family)
VISLPIPLQTMIVLLTGGSSGIGYATVRRLSERGHQVFCASRNPDRRPLPEGVVPLRLDVGVTASAVQAIETVLRIAGGLDALINNAGVGQLGAIEEVGEDVAHHVFEVNFFGPMRLARLAVPHMRSRGGGRIINVASMNDVLPAPFGGYYSASKAALTSASFVLGAEVAAFGIRVTVVSPGLFRTEMAEGLGTASLDANSAYHAALCGLRAADQKRVDAAGDPDEVATAIEGSLTSADPPARILVGADAVGFAALLKEATADDLAAMLRDYVSELVTRSPDVSRPIE